VGIGTVGAADRLGVHLSQRTRCKFAAQAGRSVQRGIGAPLGVGHHHREAAIAQLVRGRVKGLPDHLERGLDEQPARAVRALCDRIELGLGETADHVVAELGSRAQLDGHARCDEGAPELAHAVGHLPYVGEEVAAHVGRGHHRPSAIGHREP